MATSAMARNKTAQLVYSSNGRLYGKIEGRCLRKNVDGSRHFLRKPPAIAIEKYILDTYAAQMEHIEVKDRETGCFYLVSVAEAKRVGFDPKRGYEPQLAVPLACWKTTPSRRPPLPGAAAAGMKPASPVAPTGPLPPVMGSLFD